MRILAVAERRLRARLDEHHEQLAEHARGQYRQVRHDRGEGSA